VSAIKRVSQTEVCATIGSTIGLISSIMRIRKRLGAVFRRLSKEIKMATKITVNNNASLRLEGEIEIYDASGGKYDLAGREVISLCRCGHSENKPFCDGSHARCGFESVVMATVLPPMKPKV
jgi:DNA phosphorothioation-dependent restriction protein DptG